MLDLSSHADLAILSRVIGDVQQTAVGADCMLVGAMARDLRLTYAHGVRVVRRTEDIDLALAVRGWDEVKSMQERMAASRLFERTTVPQRMRHVSGIPVDLIPYGDIEGPGNRIEWPPHGDDRTRVPGYREARDAAEVVRLPNGVEIHVATLPGLLVLKLFAFEDRALIEPRKDAGDIHFILRHYIDAGNRDRLYAEYSHLLEVEDFDYVAAGAHIAGKDVRAILGALPSTILVQLETLLNHELDDEGAGRLLGQVEPQFTREFQGLLVAFKHALLET